MLLMLSASLWATDQQVNDFEGRRVYGLVKYSPVFNGKYGFSTFRTDNPAEVTLLHEWSDNVFIFSGAAAHGDYYGYFYQYSMYPNPTILGKLDIETGEVTTVADWSWMTIKFQAMTYDYSTETMYTVGFDLGKSNLYKLNIQDGTFEEIAQFKEGKNEVTLAMMACTYDGQLYGADAAGHLYMVNKETAALTYVMDILPEEYSAHRVSEMQSMEFDHTDDALYWASSHGGVNYGDEEYYHLYKIDVKKQTKKDLGEIGSGTHFVGIYIPFVEAGFGAPNVIEDLTVIPGANGAESAELKWTMPSMTYGHEPYAEGTVLSVKVERDGETLSMLSGKAGEAKSFKDPGVKSGAHTYKLTTYGGTATDEGAATTIHTWVGPDVPATIADLKQEVGADCKSVKLTWSVPQQGAHGGYYLPEGTKFKIVRYPDNELLANDYTGTTFEDKNISFLGAYRYGVTAYNDHGSYREALLTSTVVVGEAMTLPYTTVFPDMNSVSNEWTMYDANGDYCSWMIGYGYSTMIFQDYEGGIEYAADTYADADEWLISPPLKFDGSKDYYLSFDARTPLAEELRITFGNLNTIASQEENVVKAGLRTKPCYNAEKKDFDNKDFVNYQIQLPKADGIRCVGFNLVTTYEDGLFYQMNNLTISEGQADGIEVARVETEAQAWAGDDVLCVAGTFAGAEVFDMAGTKVADLTPDKAQLSTKGWPAGIYFVKVTADGASTTQKVIIR